MLGIIVGIFLIKTVNILLFLDGEIEIDPTQLLGNFFKFFMYNPALFSVQYVVCILQGGPQRMRLSKDSTNFIFAWFEEF